MRKQQRIPHNGCMFEVLLQEGIFRGIQKSSIDKQQKNQGTHSPGFPYENICMFKLVNICGHHLGRENFSFLREIYNTKRNIEFSCAMFAVNVNYLLHAEQTVSSGAEEFIISVSSYLSSSNSVYFLHNPMLISHVLS